MPQESIKLRPGIRGDLTPTLNEGGYATSNCISWQEGLPQKMRGWQKYTPSAYAGTPRASHAFADLNSVAYYALGTTTSLNALASGVSYAVTPQTLTSNNAPNFSTTLGSPTVTIVDAAAGTQATSNVIYLNTPVAVGGLILAGAYPVASVGGLNTYTITAAANATANVVSGGAVPTFTTTAGSSTVLVTLTAHGLAVGSTFVMPIAMTIGGITITAGSYTVTSVPGANSFNIVAANAAASNAGPTGYNSGNPQIIYYIQIGPPPLGTGFGIGGFGLGGFGTGAVSGQTTGTPITATDWTLDNWGQFLVACPENGPVYVWNPTAGQQNAGMIAAAPPYNIGCFLAMPQQQIICYGSTSAYSSGIGFAQDPLLITWCHANNYNQWKATTTNLAGSYRIPTGTRCVGGMMPAQQALVWTDIELWAGQYSGSSLGGLGTLVWNWNKIGTNCGLIGKHACAHINGQVYWVGVTNQVFRLGGNGPEVIQCDVWDILFQDLNPSYRSRVVMGANPARNEMMIFYPSLSGNASECDKYIKYNVNTGEWDYGNVGRSTWLPNTILGAPIAATSTGIVYQHETGADADGQPINASIETGYFMIGEGTQTALVKQFFPDMRWGQYGQAQTAQVKLTFTTVNDISGKVTTTGPFTVTQSTAYFNPRVRGHRVKIKIESSDIGSFWRLGNMRYVYQPDGRQ